MGSFNEVHRRMAMKALRFVLFSVPLMLCCCDRPAIAQTHEHGVAATKPVETNTSDNNAGETKAGDTKAAESKASKPAAPLTEAQKSFNQMKTLAGTWRGKATL